MERIRSLIRRTDYYLYKVISEKARSKPNTCQSTSRHRSFDYCAACPSALRHTTPARRQDCLPKQVKPRVSTSRNPNRSHNERQNDDEQRASASDEVEEEKRQPAPDSISSPNESLVQPRPSRCLPKSPISSSSSRSAAGRMPLVSFDPFPRMNDIRGEEGNGRRNWRTRSARDGRGEKNCDIH